MADVNPTLLRLGGSLCLVVVAFALLQPGIITGLAAIGVPEWRIGMVMSAAYAPLVVLGPLAHRVVERIGLRLTLLLGHGINIGGILLLLHPPDAAVWTIASMLMGCGSSLLWPPTDGAIAALAPRGRTGTVTGWYQTGIGASFAIGPFLPPLLPIDSKHLPWIALLWCVPAMLLCAWRPVFLPTSLTSSLGTTSPPPTADRRGLALAFGGVCVVGGMLESGANTIGTLLGLGLSWSATHAGLVPGVIGTGSLLAQVPAGRLADRHGAMPVLLGCLLLLIPSAVLLPWLVQMPWALWLAAGLWGGAGGALYTVTMTHVGQRVPAAQVQSATGMLLGLYTLGGMVGPLAGGAAVDWSHRWGATLLLLISILLAMGLLGIHRHRHPTGSPLDDTPYG